MIEDKEFCINEFNIKQYQAELLSKHYKKENTEKVKTKYKNNQIKYLTWEELDRHIDEIANKIKEKNYIGLYGIPRAGLIIALILSYKTGIPILSHAVNNCLVIDDAVSSGVAMIPYIKRYDTYAIVVDINAPYKTDYYNYYTEELIYFPWDK